MTGAVTYEQLYAILGLMGAAGGAVAGFLFWVWRLVVGVRKDFAAQLRERDTAAQLETERAKMIEQVLRESLSAYQVQVAEKYATKEGVTVAVGRMESAIEKLSTLVHESVERITSRMDRILERNDAPPAQRSRGRTPG